MKQNLFATKIKSSINQQLFYGGVAQLVKRGTHKPEVMVRSHFPLPNIMKDIYITWEDYHKKIEQLAKKIHDDNLKFNQIICIAKGGLRVGDIFSRLFNVPLAILSVEFTMVIVTI